ncbi:beta-galactosidase domain 4-containing protein [Xanthocytophaga agilis]|uniref:beta-galactosidase n=1 Tax=Xanthocytophaga agilis TaxID=3048010 RepID=A0AAE3QXC9_9BACT|nr:beta-galactosidase domain 4-containing protein [Xanthocytophaga agilis]MDJ1499205.1 DUF4981 domain-containing protein [Xanthocytophaga agilis]
MTFFICINLSAQSADEVWKDVVQPGPTPIPYESIKQILPNGESHSPFFKDITQALIPKVVTQKAISSSKKSSNQTVSSYTSYTSFQVPDNWKGKMVFVLFEPQPISFTLFIDTKKITVIEKAIPVKINITPYIDKQDNYIDIRVEGSAIKKGTTFNRISLLATPQVHIDDYYLFEEYCKLPNRMTDWNVKFTTRNYSEVSYLYKYHYLFALFDQDNRAVEIDSFNHEEIGRALDKGDSYPFGVYHYGLHNFKRWNSESHYLYHFTLQAIDSSCQIAEVIGGSTGFRVVDVRNNKLYLGNIPVSSPITIQAVQYTPPVSYDSVWSKESMRTILQSIKDKHVNAVILPPSQTSTPLYELCDEIGLYIIQKMDSLDQKSLTGLSVEEKQKKKDLFYANLALSIRQLRKHPSVIIWQLNQKFISLTEDKFLIDLINKEDGGRPVVFTNKTYSRYATWAKSLAADWELSPVWNNLSQARKEQLKKEYQYADFTIKQHTDNRIIIKNIYDFTRLDNVYLQWSINENGKLISEGTIDSLDILPHKEQLVVLPFDLKEYKSRTGIVFRFSLKSKEGAMGKTPDEEIAWEEFVFVHSENGTYLIKTADVRDK